MPGAKEYYDLAGARVEFYQGEFYGLNTFGSDGVTLEYGDGPDEYQEQHGTSWSISPYVTGPTPSVSTISGYWQVLYFPSLDVDRRFFNEEVSYTLVNTEPEPVPEPLTAGGTALALGGLSWLKHKKKMAA